MNYNDKALGVINEVGKVVIGKDICIAKIMAAIIAGGNILMDDVPGVGKTTMALAFSQAMGLENKRVQFTPDVLPGDITGFTMYDKSRNAFVYRPGAVMCNLFMADEINRTSPKTQSALLEVMEEGHVTVDGTTYPVPDPFIVIATENPIGSAGTQLLPDSQLDRFMICLKLGYPSIENELDIVKGKTSAEGFDKVYPVIDAAILKNIRMEVTDVKVGDDVYSYIGQLITETRDNPNLELGASPRGTIALTRMAKSWAYISGRDFVIPEDVQMVWTDVMRHRIILNAKARVNHITQEAVLKDIMERVYKPTVRRKSGVKKQSR
ncbi:MAG: MoxR family ATPase [Clostridiales bacterium]|nr:MoxR family ATPase [Clostridiales bacterium]